jgi:hypothetical protein
MVLALLWLLDLERRGDEARHHVGIGAVVRGSDRDDRVFGARILQHRQRVVRAHSEHQDEKADNGGEDRAANENVGEIHRKRTQWSIGTGAASAVGVTELSTVTTEPLCSLICPAVTMVSPASMPLRMAT